MINQKENSVIFPNAHKLDSTSSFTLEDFQSLLISHGVSQDLCTHPVVISFLKKVLAHFSQITAKQIERLLDDNIIIISPIHSFSIIFHNEHNDQSYTYALDDSLLVYTKKVFTNNSCLIFNRLFDQNGKRIHSEKEFYPLSSTQSTIGEDTKKENNDRSL